ncbi:hypothetical protein TSAR_001930 [Trichomalopsis sarcophagae]|uniref:Major facilitator superfamily (MFS) profile domain-containing protein n=1 Tax=Trichomalopsis sarcophagae TaxID=543379 RepID=A0A232FKG0_9HYME|nr:hypothetical protein TSAR_001930 [Trichomalopsis sarcophagae]
MQGTNVNEVEKSYSRMVLVWFSFSYGCLAGCTTLLLTELTHKKSKIEITKDELSWFVGTLLISLLSHTTGSRMVFLVASIVYSTYYATKAMMILVAQAFIGFIIPSTILYGTMNITEIAQPHSRSPLATRKGRYSKAEAALTWLRGWTSSDDIRHEFLALKEANAKETSDDNKSEKQSLMALLKPCKEKSLWIPMCIVFYISIMFKLSGSEVIETYNVVIFRMNETPFDIYISGAIYEIGCIAGAIARIFSINALGKKKLLFASLVGAGSAYLVITIVVHLIKLEIGNTSGYLYWIPPVMLIFASFR